MNGVFAARRTCNAYVQRAICYDMVFVRLSVTLAYCEFVSNSKRLTDGADFRCMYVCILRARVQPTLDPYAEAFL